MSSVPRSAARLAPAPHALRPLAHAARVVILMALAAAGTGAHAQDRGTLVPAEDAAVVELPGVVLTGRGDGGAAATEAYAARRTTTATKLDLTPRETPQSVSVVTRAQMDDFGLTNVNDLLSSTTGVTVERVETDRTYFSVRGFDVSNFQLDGIGLPFATGDQMGDLDTAFYERVEVLRGANGLMSSTGNPSATVNFVRKRPTADFRAAAGVTLGSWNDRRVDGDLSTALNAAGTVRARLTAASQTRDSYLDRYSLEKNLVAGVVEADVAPGTVLTLGHAEQHNRPNSPMWGALPLFDGNGASTDFPRSANTAAEWAYWNTDDTQTFAQLARELAGGWKLNAVAMRRVIRSDAEIFYVYGTPDPATGGGLFSYPSKYHHKERQTLADVYASGPFTLGGRRHDLVVGMNWAKSDNDLHSSDDDVGVPLTVDEVLAGSFPRPAFDAGETGFADFHDRRTSLYAAARFNPSDALKLITGANVTRATSEGVQYGEVHRYGKTKTTPYVGATYDLHPNVSLYASYATIFNPQYKLDRTNATLPPIEGSNAEIGVKSEWMDKRLQASFALFRTRQDNTAEYDTFINGHSAYKPVHAQSEGFELDLAGRLAPGWEASAGYTQLSIEDRQTGLAAREYVPRKLLRLSTTWRPAALSRLKLGASLKWQDDTRRDQGSGVITRQPAYALLDLMARYDFSRRLSATVNLNNVTDRKYLTSLYWAQAYYGAPRNVTVSLNWQY